MAHLLHPWDPPAEVIADSRKLLKVVRTGIVESRRFVELSHLLIADSRNAVAMKEGEYPVVYYVPRSDVRMERLVRTSHRTHCPFKGDASYYSITEGPENAVWSYEQPYDEMRAIEGLLACYPDKVEIALT